MGDEVRELLERGTLGVREIDLVPAALNGARLRRRRRGVAITAAAGAVLVAVAVGSAGPGGLFDRVGVTPAEEPQLSATADSDSPRTTDLGTPDACEPVAPAGPDEWSELMGSQKPSIQLEGANMQATWSGSEEIKQLGSADPTPEQSALIGPAFAVGPQPETGPWVTPIGDPPLGHIAVTVRLNDCWYTTWLPSGTEHEQAEALANSAWHTVTAPR